jgi:hypothetical protein
MTKMNPKVQKVLDRILESFASGDVPEALTIVILPKLDVPCSAWSLANRLVLFFSGTSDARGFRQWQAVGRYPKKGSKACYILTPRHRKMKDKEHDEEKFMLTGFAAAPVFKFEDTDGEPIDRPEYPPKQMPPLYEVAQRWGIAVNWQGFQGDAYGYFSPGRKEIVLATHNEQVFFHELAHAAHEKVLGKLKNAQDWKQEIVAELTAAVLAHLFGRKTNDGGSYRYIRRYAEDAGKDVYRACLSVIGDVGKCVEMVMQMQEEMVVTV